VREEESGMQHDFILLDRSQSMADAGKWPEAVKAINLTRYGLTGQAMEYDEDTRQRMRRGG